MGGVWPPAGSDDHRRCRGSARGSCSRGRTVGSGDGRRGCSCLRAAGGVPATPDTATMLAQLKQLGELRDAGILTDAEFEVQKARILTG